MKNALLLSVFLCICTTTQESVKRDKPYVVAAKTNFQLAFERINRFEGYYVNHPRDKGGETYRGVARNFNHQWLGWIRVDDYKKDHSIRWNQQIKTADFLVLDYYLDIWIKEGFDKIQDRDLAIYVFEFRIHGNAAVRVMRKLLVEKGAILPINNKIDSVFITNINFLPPKLYIKDLRKKRIKYYNDIVRRDTTQRIFLKHWKSRV